MDTDANNAIQKLLKTKGLNLSFGEDTDSVERITFGLPQLDKLLGGGIPKNRFTLIYGPPNVGKSYLSSLAVSRTQQDGGTAMWVDTEMSYDKDWMSRCGVDQSKILVAQPSTGEAAMGHVREGLAAGIDIVVLDSIAGLIPTAMTEEIEKGNFAHSPMAWQGRFVNSSFPKLFPYLKNGSAFIAINQMRQSLGGIRPTNTWPGGQGQTFFAHAMLEVRRDGWIKEKINGTEETVGFDMQVRMHKSKIGGENWKAAVVPFKADGGIDIIETFMRDGIAVGVIEQAGTWYTYQGTKVQGLNGLKSLFLEAPTLLEELQNELTT